MPRAAGGEMQSATLSVWDYSLGEVVSAVASAGLRAEFVHEHPATFYRQFPTLVEGNDGLWRWPDPSIRLPLLFSLLARQPPEQLEELSSAAEAVITTQMSSSSVP